MRSRSSVGPANAVSSAPKSRSAVATAASAGATAASVGEVGGLKGDASRARDAQRAAPELLDVEEHEARVAPEVRAGLAGREACRQFRELRCRVQDLCE